MRAYLLALLLTLGGCSAAGVVQNWAPPASPELSPPDYRRVVAENISKILPGSTPLNDVEISGMRLVDHLRGPAWITCLKLDAHGKPQNFSVFIQGDQIVDSRMSVVIDQCHKGSLKKSPAADSVLVNDSLLARAGYARAQGAGSTGALHHGVAQA